jgi:hypothetical protein
MDSTNTLSQIVVSQAYKEVTANELFAAMSSAAAYGRNADTCGGLTFGYYGARYGGASVANGTNTCGASTTTYMVADRATGAVSFSTSATNWSDVLNYGRCFKIVTGTATVTSYEDHRSGPMGAHAQSSFSGIDIYTKNPDTTTGLTWGYLGGLYNGNTIANGTVTLTNTADNYVVVLRSTGVVSTSTTSTNSVDPLYAKLYKVTCAGSVVTATVDQRTDANGLLFGAPASASDVAAATHAATSKSTPVDADELPIADSAASYALKKLTWANLKAGIWSAWGALINSGTGKSTPVDADAFAIMDSAASNATKSLTFTNLKAFLKTYFDTLYGTGSGTVTSVDASGGVQTASGSAIAATGTVRGAHVINAQTGTTYAVVSGDRGKHLTLSNAASIAATIAQAGTTGFEDGYFVYLEAIGVGAVTLTPTTSTINGAATLVLDSGMSAVLFSDGTNYRAIVVGVAGVVVNAQTGTTYTYLSGDRGKLVTHTNASAIAGTLPQATGAFGASWFAWVQNRGVGTLTITPTTSTIDGSATLALTTGQGTLIASDGTNYFTMRGIGSSSGVAASAVTVSDAGGFFNDADAESVLQDLGRARSVAFSDPAYQWYGASGVTVATTASQITGDPFVVWDGTQWVLFYYESTTGAPYVKVNYRTAPTLEGTWSSATNLSSLNNYHKFVLLVDEVGAPVVISSNYHGYAVKYVGALTDKEIYHFTCSTLTGTWTLGSKVIAKGASGDKDEYNTDTPYALYKAGTIYLWYMGGPASSLTTYGWAIRLLRATATIADGPFTKSSGDVLLPNTSAAWDYGWMGGVQIRLRPNGSYVMVYNAGDTRPTSGGLEPNTSRIGYAYASSIDGPWSKDAGNPYITPTGVPSDSGQTVETTNIWRGHIAFDPRFNRWVMFYNTGQGTSPAEKLTYGRQGIYDYFDVHVGSPYLIQAITTSVVVVANSQVNVAPGIYRVYYQFNVVDLGVTKPALDIDLALRLNGTAIQTSRDFVGSYNYENRDIIIRKDVAVTAAASYFDCTVQCTGGTPTASTQIRRLRVVVERIG